MSLPSTINSENETKYLVFYLGKELYGVHLTSIKEVIKVAEMKPVPHMRNYFKGVINLRGQIVSIVDLREKFDIKKSDQKGLILVVEHTEGVIGAIVDELDCVCDFEKNQIDQNPVLETKIPLTFFKGVAKKDNRLVNIVDVASSLTSEDYRTMKAMSA